MTDTKPRVMEVKGIAALILGTLFIATGVAIMSLALLVLLVIVAIGALGYGIDATGRFMREHRAFPNLKRRWGLFRNSYGRFWGWEHPVDRAPVKRFHDGGYVRGEPPRIVGVHTHEQARALSRARLGLPPTTGTAVKPPPPLLLEHRIKPAAG